MEDLEAIIKEGRILSTSNRAFVKGVADHTYEVADELKATGDRLMELYNATEPPGKVEAEEGKQLVDIKDTKAPEVTIDVVDTKKEEKSDLTPEQIGEIVEVAITKALSEGNFTEIIKEGQE